MNFNRWLTEYVDAAGGGDCQIADLTVALDRSEHWLNESVEEFIARAEALLEAVDLEGGKKALVAELKKSSIGIDEVVDLLWAQQTLLTVIRRSPQKLTLMTLKEEQTEEGPLASWSSDPVRLEELLPEGLEALHIIWLAVGRKAGLKHPVAPLIEAWLQRPEQIRPDLEKNGRPRKNGIMPSGLFTQQPATVPAQLAFTLDNGDPSLGRVESPQAQLPLFADLLAGEDIPVTPLLLANAAGFRGLQPGRGARLDKRLLIFSLLSMPLDQRRPGGRYEWRPSLKELRDLFWPTRSKIVNGRRWEVSSYRPGKHARSLYSALQAINLAEVVMPDSYHWRPTIVRGYPSFDNLDSTVIVQIELPSGSDHGPAVDKPSLIEAGTISDPAFDLELGLSYLWDEAKRRNGGYRIHATRPEVLRNDQGHIVDTKDNMKSERNGKPSTRWDHAEAVLTGRQERHPQASKVRVLTRAERHRLAYGIIGDKHTSQIRNEQSATDRLLISLEKNGRIVIERDAVEPGTGKRGWRILEAWSA